MARVTLLVLFALTQFLLAAGNQISGIVKDSQTGDPLVGAVVEIPALQIGTTTDSDGFFLLDNIPVGSHELSISYIGYKTYRVLANVGKEDVRLTIALLPTPLAGKAINVVATRAIAGKTPAAFTDLSSEEISLRYYAQDIPVLLSEMPSTTFYSENGSGLGYTYLSIRGFDQRRISVMINGVPQNDPEDHNVYWVDFPDFLSSVEEIQVQRGAGSAFYGPPAIGGSINIITNAFSPERKITVYSGGGSYKTSKFGISANSGLINNRWVVNARMSQVKTDGYRESSKLDFKSYFVGVAYFGEKSSAKFHFYGGPIEDQLAYIGISKAEAKDPKRRRTNYINDPREIENFNQPHAELIHTWQINSQTTLQNTLYYIKGYGFFDYQGNWAPFSYYRLTPEFGFDVQGDPESLYASDIIIRAYVDNDQVGWFPNLTLQHHRGQLIFGSELRTHRSLHWGRIQEGSADLPPATGGEWQGHNYIGKRRYYEYKGGKDIFSPYVFSEYQLNSHLALHTALQLVVQRYKLFDEKFVGTEFDINYTFLNPRVGLQYKLAKDWRVFGSIAYTNREPRLKNYYDAAEASTPASWGAVVPQFEQNPDGSFNFEKPLVKPEKLTDLELGISYLGRKYEGHINLFYMDFRDEIVKSGQLDRFGQPITGNAPRTLHAGIELSGKWQFNHWLSANGNLTYSRNEIKEYNFFTDVDGDGNVDALDLSGNAIAGFPDFLANLRLTLNRRGLSASVHMQHVGKFFTDNFEAKRYSDSFDKSENFVDAYTVFHGVIGYNFGRFLPGEKSFLLQLHVRNIFDKLYIAHGEGSDFFPAAERHFFVNAKIDL
jgi:iron complex outermembrane receptor protein